MSRWQTIIFDLDDTLYLERDYVLSGFQAVAECAAAQLDIPAETGFAELKDLFERGVRGNTFDEWLHAHGFDDQDMVSSLLSVYRGHTPKIKPCLEVPGLLKHLNSRYRLGLLSDGHLEVQRRKLTALTITNFFDVIIFTDELGRENWKPSVRPFSVLLERLKTTASKAVYVADNPAKDFLGANRAGIRSIRVRRNLGLYRDLKCQTTEHEPDLEVCDLKNLTSDLDDLAKASC